jgi:hypothetical protein
MKFSVLTAELQAALLFAGTDETRAAINGVRIECLGGKGSLPVLVATDGRRIAIIETQAKQFNDFGEFELVLSRDFLKPFLVFAKSLAPTIIIEPHPPKRVIFEFREKKCVIDSEEGALVESRFPKWRQVLPSGKKEAVDKIGVGAEYIADFYKVGKLFDLEVPVLQLRLYGATGAIEVKIDTRPQFYGLLMPCKTNEASDEQPEFLGMGKELEITKVEPGEAP